MSENHDAPAVACTLTPEIAAEQSDRITATMAEGYLRAEELDDGYAFAFEGTEDALEALAGFVATELRCCSFAEYTIETEPPYEETRLTVTGPDGTTELFGRAFADLLESARA